MRQGNAGVLDRQKSWDEKIRYVRQTGVSEVRYENDSQNNGTSIFRHSIDATV